MAEMNDDLFGNLDSKMNFLEEKKQVSADGIYRIDMSKCKDKKKGYRAKVRFLPNLTKSGTLGQLALEKITHYVNIKNPKELSGWFDSPKNFNEKCPLTELYYSMANSKNAMLQEKAKCLNYSKKYYSYVLVLEDENQPETVGKIMIYQYGKTIKDKIAAEKSGEITGSPCNVFDLSAGKDFILYVKEIETGGETYPDYKMSQFASQTTPVQIYKDGQFKAVPVGADAKIEPKYHEVIKKALLEREHDLEEFSAKKLSDEEHGKINDIIAFLTGKSSANFTSSNTTTKTENVASTEDFDFNENATSKQASTTSVTDEDDFFDV
jgi:hypothetical protein